MASGLNSWLQDLLGPSASVRDEDVAFLEPLAVQSANQTAAVMLNIEYLNTLVEEYKCEGKLCVALDQPYSYQGTDGSSPSCRACNVITV